MKGSLFNKSMCLAGTFVICVCKWSKLTWLLLCYAMAMLHLYLHLHLHEKRNNQIVDSRRKSGLRPAFPNQTVNQGTNEGAAPLCLCWGQLPVSAQSGYKCAAVCTVLQSPVQSSRFLQSSVSVNRGYRHGAELYPPGAAVPVS